MNTYSNDDDIRLMLENIRNGKNRVNSSNKSLIKEEEEKDTQNKNSDIDYSDAIAITDDPKFGQEALSSQIDQFKSVVESGAQFTKPGDGKVSEAPLIFIPSTNNLVFSGIIPCLNNLKFQFVLKTTTGNGCFIWVDELNLNKDNIQILNKLYSFYLNWRESWNAESADLEKMVNNLKNM